MYSPIDNQRIKNKRMLSQRVETNPANSLFLLSYQNAIGEQIIKQTLTTKGGTGHPAI